MEKSLDSQRMCQRRSGPRVATASASKPTLPIELVLWYLRPEPCLRFQIKALYSLSKKKGGCVQGVLPAALSRCKMGVPGDSLLFEYHQKLLEYTLPLLKQLLCPRDPVWTAPPGPRLTQIMIGQLERSGVAPAPCFRAPIILSPLEQQPDELPAIPSPRARRDPKAGDKVRRRGATGTRDSGKARVQRLFSDPAHSFTQHPRPTCAPTRPQHAQPLARPAAPVRRDAPGHRANPRRSTERRDDEDRSWRPRATRGESSVLAGGLGYSVGGSACAGC